MMFTPNTNAYVRPALAMPASGKPGPYMAEGIIQRLEPRDQLSLAMNWFYFGIKVLILLATLFAFVLSLAVAFGVLLSDSTDLNSFTTNTFHVRGTPDVNLTWQILPYKSSINTPRDQTNQYSLVRYEHIRDCLVISRFNTNNCTQPTGSDDYKTCVLARYTAMGQVCETTALPDYNWPTAEKYAQCVSLNMNENRSKLNAFKTCLRTKPWPMFEAPLDQDTGFFLGSFSWPGLMITGLFVFTSFALYTIYPMDWEDVTIIEYGKPKSSMSRMGFLWTFPPLVCGAAWAAITILIAFRSGGTWPNSFTNYYPTSQTTNIVTVTASMSLLFYFLLEMSEYYDRKNVNHPGSAKNPEVETGMKVLPGTIMMGGAVAKGYQAGTGHGGHLGYYFPDPTESKRVDAIQDAGMQYTPVLLNTWADAYLFDVLFFVGAAGATLQNNTAEVYTLFWALVYYRVAHMGVVRMVYQSYVRNETEDPVSNDLKDQGLPSRHEFTRNPSKDQERKNASLCMKINALSLHFASICAVVIVYWMLWNKNRMWSDYGILQNLFMMGFLIPEALKILGHVYLLLRTTEITGAKGVYILVFAHFIWLWDLAIRGIFVYLYFYGADSVRGTKPYIVDKFNDTAAVILYNAF